MARRARVPRGYSAWAAWPRPRGGTELGSDASAAMAGGNAAAGGSKVSGEQRGGKGGAEPSCRPPRAGLSLCPQPRPASAGMEPMVRRDCRLRKSAGAVYGFQGCNATPPSSPWRDIPPPPAPYAACALTQGVTPAIVICCVTRQDTEPGRRRHKAKPCMGLMCGENTVAEQGAGQPEGEKSHLCQDQVVSWP